jgi:phosphoribosylamine---glycine ligase
VVEFNARFGDPETQPLLARLQTPLGGLLHAAATGRLADEPELVWSDRAAVGVVLAAQGYPGTPVTGGALTGLVEAAEDGALVVQAGTTEDAHGQVVSSGGRVLTVVGTGPDLAAARQVAYAGIERIGLEGSFYRHDIAQQAASREAQDTEGRAGR